MVEGRPPIATSATKLELPACGRMSKWPGLNVLRYCYKMCKHIGQCPSRIRLKVGVQNPLLPTIKQQPTLSLPRLKITWDEMLTSPTCRMLTFSCTPLNLYSGRRKEIARSLEGKERFRLTWFNEEDNRILAYLAYYQAGTGFQSREPPAHWQPEPMFTASAAMAGRSNLDMMDDGEDTWEVDEEIIAEDHCCSVRLRPQCLPGTRFARRVTSGPYLYISNVPTGYLTEHQYCLLEVYQVHITREPGIKKLQTKWIGRKVASCHPSNALFSPAARSGCTFSPWDEIKASTIETIPPNRPFHLKERLEERIRESKTKTESDDLQDNPEIDDDVPEGSPASNAPQPPPNPFSSSLPLQTLPRVAESGPQRTKTAKNTHKDAKKPGKASPEASCDSRNGPHADFSLENDTQISLGGYSGKKQAFERVHDSVAELEAQGLKEVKWNAENPCALLDSDGYVAGVLGGSPHGTNWPKVNEEASNACRNAWSMLSFTEKQANHRRMDAPAMAIGVSFGGGAKRPGNLKQSSQMALLVMTTLLGTLAFARIAGFANCLFMAYAFKPRVPAKQGV
ncbi:hypothetical protein BT96DRAFT_940181 [Gymnopus androsaceus JB14]|uniref:Uncharacterized protein n=1 Tax=Gymnopus androsaceus JB14 TaxID=1447944 RepID=A0A6A4HMW2_9AGAR|nr:hypothetical protein BT96DRAFT_940181 [Gymnopus androsaceus JB14]